jgi:predicted metalloprotease with PDZ domain
MKRAMRITAAVVLLMAGLSAAAVAQRVTGRAAPGWIGISFEISGDARGRARSVEVTEVRTGSPAEDAGVRAGDLLLSINELDSPEELGELSERLRLRAGDRVILVVERNGRRQRIPVIAAERPRDFAKRQTMEFSLQADSMVESWVRAMDSLRIRLVERGGQDVRNGRARRTVEGRLTVVAGGSTARPVSAPFEFFVFRGEEHDSLHQEMLDLNSVITELDLRLRQRERELSRVLGTRNDRRFARDSEFRRLQVALDQAAVRSAGLQTAMAEAARATAGVEYSKLAPRVRSTASLDESPRVTEFRPLTPYLLGRNRVAGAEVVDLRPELAEYFEVEGGVLVVDVVAGTPAAIAGIVPGDVITRLDQVSVRSVQDLRFGVSQAGETLPIALIRQGTSIQVLLRR